MGQADGALANIWARAKPPLAEFDRKGDHLICTPMRTRFIPDAYPDAYQRSSLCKGNIGARPYH